MKHALETVAQFDKREAGFADSDAAEPGSRKALKAAGLEVVARKRGKAQIWTAATVKPVVIRFAAAHPDPAARTMQSYVAWAKTEGEAAPSYNTLWQQTGGLAAAFKAAGLEVVAGKKGKAQIWTAATVKPVVIRFAAAHPDPAARTMQSYVAWAKTEGEAAPSYNTLRLQTGGLAAALKAAGLEVVAGKKGKAQIWTAATVKPVVIRFAAAHPDPAARTKQSYVAWVKTEGEAAPSYNTLWLQTGGLRSALRCVESTAATDQTSQHISQQRDERKRAERTSTPLQPAPVGPQAVSSKVEVWNNQDFKAVLTQFHAHRQGRPAHAFIKNYTEWAITHGYPTHQTLARWSGSSSALQAAYSQLVEQLTRPTGADVGSKGKPTQKLAQAGP